VRPADEPVPHGGIMIDVVGKHPAHVLYWDNRITILYLKSGTKRDVIGVKIIAASDKWLNIDNEEEWHTQNCESCEKAIVHKKNWPTYAIALTIYKKYFPLDPPIEIHSIDEIDDRIISQVKNRISKFTTSY
jgi:hypothetical protein